MKKRHKINKDEKPPLCPNCLKHINNPAHNLPAMKYTPINSVESFVTVNCFHCGIFLSSAFRPTVLMQGKDPLDLQRQAQRKRNGQTPGGLIVPQSVLNARKGDKEDA